MAYTDPQIMITLCELSYTDENPLPGETVQQQEARMLGDINNSLSSTMPGWSVAWGPVLTLDRGNMMFIAGNATTNQYALAIRGTDWHFILDWLQDLTVLQLVPAPYNANVKIAFGTAIGITALYNQTAGSVSTGAQMTASAFLKSLPATAKIYVTGHSLGGCLASAIAPWFVTDGVATTTLQVYTYAAPTAGEQAFATYYNNLFGTRAFRYYNAIDLVPNAWATVAAIKQLFTPWPTCPALISNLINWALPAIPAYVQTGSAAAGSAISLPGVVHFDKTMVPVVKLPGPINDLFWAQEVGVQHAGSYYAQLLGAPPITAHSAKLAAVVANVPKPVAPPVIPISGPTAN